MNRLIVPAVLILALAGAAWGNPRPMVVQFPFYVDSLSLFPDTIAAYELGRDTKSALRIIPINANNSVALGIPLKPDSVTIWQIIYSQRILSHHARYILTSTAAWNKPLEDATYRFVVPSAYNGVKVWPEADTTIINGEYKEYISHKTKFMPRRDMEIYWNIGKR